MSSNLTHLYPKEFFKIYNYHKGEKEMENSITNPRHYTEDRQYEPRKVIMDWGLNFHLGNVVKYISRAGRKGDANDHIDDLLKAKQYLEWEIERVTNMYCNQTMDEAYEYYEKEKIVCPSNELEIEMTTKVEYTPNEYGETYD